MAGGATAGEHDPLRHDEALMDHPTAAPDDKDGEAAAAVDVDDFLGRKPRKRFRADELMLHQRQITLACLRVFEKQLLGDGQPENRIADKFERLVLKVAHIVPGSVREALVRPRPMRQRPLKELEFLKPVSEGLF